MAKPKAKPSKAQIKGARALAERSLGDSATLYTATESDNGFGMVATDAIRDVVTARAVPIEDDLIPEGIRVARARHWQVTLPEGTEIAVGERMDVSGAGISGGRIIAVNSDRSEDKIVVLAMVAVVGSE